jgi:hypothetical protein
VDRVSAGGFRSYYTIESSSIFLSLVRPTGPDVASFLIRMGFVSLPDARMVFWLTCVSAFGACGECWR